MMEQVVFMVTQAHIHMAPSLRRDMAMVDKARGMGLRALHCHPEAVVVVTRSVSIQTLPTFKTRTAIPDKPKMALVPGLHHVQHLSTTPSTDHSKQAAPTPTLHPMVNGADVELAAPFTFLRISHQTVKKLDKPTATGIDLAVLDAVHRHPRMGVMIWARGTAQLVSEHSRRRHRRIPLTSRLRFREESTAADLGHLQCPLERARCLRMQARCPHMQAQRRVGIRGTILPAGRPGLWKRMARSEGIGFVQVRSDQHA